MNPLGRAKSIILKPSQTWLEIKEEKTTISELYATYAAILAAIPAVAQLIGYGLIGHSMLGAHIRWGIGRAFGHAILFYILSLVGVYVVALITDALAPSFGSKKNVLNAFKTVVYSMTPGWVGGIFYLIPPLSVLAFLAALYGIYLFYLGLPALMETPKEKSIAYVVIVIVLSFVVNIVIGAIAGAIF
ncbi:MAG: Yip1 family protein [Thermodesulfobacteriota bacterium]